MSTLPINDIVALTVQISPTTAAASAFNLGLIIGPSTIVSAATRVTVYSSLTAMITAGFASSMPEYIAANLYFNQSPKPSQVAIGRQDLTATESFLVALTACRITNQNWYGVYLCDALAADITACAAFIEAATPPSAFFYTTADAAVLAGTAGNVMLLLQTAMYSRTTGQYSTSAYAAASIMGYAMAANTTFANSAYTLAYKSEPGVVTENLTEAQVVTIKGQNGNVYINRGNTYNVFEQGVMASGRHFDEIIGLDMLVSRIQTAVMNLLVSVAKVPQTDGGVTMLILAVTGACESARTQGFLAPGTWTAQPILSLNTGDTLAKGYLILSTTVASQSPTDRANRIAPPIYACVKLAGAIENVAIQVDVNR